MTGDLDPVHWGDFRDASHELLDAAIDQLEMGGQGPVWMPVAQELRDRLDDDLPLIGLGPNAVATQMAEMLPYGVGNTHPRFFGWVHGGGAPGGLLAEIIAAALNINAGGPNHLGPLVEKQVIKWAAEIMGFPKDASGLLVSGTSLATIVALKVARDQAGGGGDLVGYTSEQAHACTARAFDMLGLGKDALRKIPCNDAFEVDVTAMKAAIAEDRAAAKKPFLIVGNAGTVNTGAIDDLSALADLARAEGLWYHVDGAFAAAGMISENLRPDLKGLEAADSLAFDFHKWFQVNYEAGCVLFRDEAKHRASFDDRAAYMAPSDEGFGDAFWAVDYGPELSRGFRALKVWAHIVEHGTLKLSEMIDRNVALAARLKDAVEAAPELELLAPVQLQICCFRFAAQDVDLNALNQKIVARLQDSGTVLTSSTMLGETFAIRANITNHRTQEADVDALVEAVVEAGKEIAASDAQI